MMNKYRMMLFQFSDGKGGNNLEKKKQSTSKKICIKYLEKKETNP